MNSACHENYFQRHVQLNDYSNKMVLLILLTRFLKFWVILQVFFQCYTEEVLRKLLERARGS